MSLTTEDAEELRQLLARATRPAVRAVLERALSAPLLTPQPAAPAPAPSPAPSSSSASSSLSAAAPRSVTPRYAFEQDNMYVTVLVFDLPPLTPELRAGITCAIAPASCSLTIPHPAAPPGAAGFRLELSPLDKEVDVEESSFKAKKTQVEIKLRKKLNWENWASLVQKEGKSPAEVEKDPSAGLHTMMKDLYDKGDDNMKRTIAEAMQKSRQGGGPGWEAPQGLGGDSFE